MPRHIKILEQIQKVDLDIIAVVDEQKEYEEKSGKVAGELESAETEAATLASEIEETEKLVAGIELRLKETDDKARKADQRMRDVRNDRELKALSREKIEAGKAKRALDAELAEFSGKLDELRRALEANRAASSESAGELERIRGEIAEKESDWSALLKEKQAEKDALSGELPADLLGRYEAIRERRGGRAVVSVKKEACQGCFMHIPPQTYIQLKRGDEEIISCPHCHRILYVEDEATPEAV